VTESSDAAVLGRAGNYAVVQVPARRFPALAIQGDSLHILCEVMGTLRESLDSGDQGLDAWFPNVAFVAS
jgi:hypothetical protein